MDKIEEIVLSALVIPIMKEIITPKIKEISQKFVFKNVDHDIIEANFEEYISRRYEKFLIIDTLVFPNKQTQLKILYEPLTIETSIKDKKEQITIDGYPKDFLPKYVRSIIVDTGGMGKSTITKKLFLSAIEEKLGIPILIELRKINKDNDFLNEICKQLFPVGKDLISKDFMLRLIDSGDFIFLFDGLDEISREDRDFVLTDLNEFIEKANDNYFLITSRYEENLPSFGDFQKFKVRPLKEEEAYSLINRYDQYSFHPIASELIKQLKENKDRSLKEFLTNPFLVSLLYKSFEFKKDIPQKKGQFYRQVFDALFEAHDLSKEGYFKRDKHSNLNVDDFERVLRHLGYFTAIDNKVEYDKDGIINYIDRTKVFVTDLKFNSSDLLKDLLETVPLFTQEGPSIRWAHKSLQDYFAAKFIWVDAKSKQEAILDKIYKDERNQRFFNIVDLFSEFDPKTFQNTITHWFLKDYTEYMQADKNTSVTIDESDFLERKSLLYGKSFTLLISLPEKKKKKIDEVHPKSKKIKNPLDLMFEGDEHTRMQSVRIIDSKEKSPKTILLFGRVDREQTFINIILKREQSICSKIKPQAIDFNLIENLTANHPIPIDLNPKSALNNLENFKNSTQLLLLDKIQIVGYEKAVQRLSELEEAKNKRISDAFMDW